MPETDTTQKVGVTGVLVNAAAFVIIVAGIREASAIFVQFFLALFISVLLGPPFFWLKSRGAHTGIALVAVLLIGLSATMLLGTILGTSLDGLLNALPSYERALNSQFSLMLAWLRSLGADIPQDPFLKLFDISQIMNLARGTVRGVAAALNNVLFITLMVVFILIEASGFPDKLRAISDDSDKSLPNLFKAIDNVKRYMAIKTLISLGTGIGIAIALTIIGVDFPILWGLLAFLLNYIPNIGSLIAAVPAVLLALVQFGWPTAILTVGIYLGVNFVFANVMEPRIMGQGLGLSTLVVFLSLLFWGWVLGPVGMLLSVPLTMTAKIILDTHESTRKIAILLSAGTKTSTPV